MAEFDPEGAPGGDTSGSSGSSSSAPKKKKEKSKLRQGLQAAGQDLNERSVDDLKNQARDAAERITSFKRGGTKRGKGLARLHKRELVMAPKKGKRKAGRMNGRA